MTVKIYGLGWVGRAMVQLFPDAIIHDPDQNLISHAKATVGFVCVPSPNLDDGSLDTSIVEEVVAMSQEDLIVVRSTVNPGTCDALAKEYGKRIVFEPEFLGETPNHPMLDPHTRQWKIIGGAPEDRKKLIDLYTGVYNANINIRQVTNLEAEVVKLSENRAIAFKVAQAQELYDVCEAAGVDYYTIRDAVYGDDPRFNLWWTFVYPEKRGMDSKCIPKDIIAWKAWAESVGYFPYVTNALLVKNEEWVKSNDEN